MDSGAAQSGGCFGGKGDVRPEEMEILQNFHNSSFYFPYVLDYGSSIRAMVDFSDLWYREFFLEITRQVQFPIHMSLPWILTEHLLANQSAEAPMLENLLHALDVYNDAAQRSLYSIDRQFMYDEIEAELNLAFDQFSFLVADEIYGYFKNMASGLVMDTEYKKKINAFGDSNAFQQAYRRFKIPLQQRHIKLLGRAVDLNYIVSQHVNEKISQDIETSVRRFESQDPTSFVDFDVTLNVLSRTHALLSDHLSIIPFEVLLLEVNEGGETASHKTRIAMHILDDLVNDLIPNFSYNVRTQRFYRSPVCNRKTSYNSAPKAASSTLYGDLCYKAYEAQGRLYRGFVGKEHLQHMVHLLGSSLPHIVKELVDFLKERLLLIKIYTAALQPGIPPCKLPKFVFQLGGCYTYFKEYLKPLLNHEDLKPVVFQTFREFGNTVALLQDLSDLIDIEEITRMVQLAPYTSAQGAGKKVSKAQESPLARCAAAMQPELKTAPGMKVSKVSEDLSKAALRFNEVYDNLASCKSLIQLVVKKLDDFMIKQDMKKEWLGVTPENGIIDIESTREFYRFWSAISFIFSCEDNPGKELNGPQDEFEYADGFVLGGIFLVLLLGQRERFEMLDFSRHLISVHEYEVATAFSGNAKVGMVDNSTIEEAHSFIDRALKKQKLERDIFDMCDEAFKPSTTEPLTFRPPRF